MESCVPGRLADWEIHGFRTMADLDIATIIEEAKTRWLRPNELYAILRNYNFFTIHVKPMNLPKSGTIVLFDRKMLRNFRKDGHNWKKKNDGKTVKEAHEHLKVGDEERIHVYYAHGYDNPAFVRRCYWLLDKKLGDIVLVHYRETQELQGSPGTSVNSNSSSRISGHSPRFLSEETDTGTGCAYYSGGREHLDSREDATVRDVQKRLHEINTLEWDELVVTNNPNVRDTDPGDQIGGFHPHSQNMLNGSKDNGSQLPINNLPIAMSSYWNLSSPLPESNDLYVNNLEGSHIQVSSSQLNSHVHGNNDAIFSNSLDILGKLELQIWDSFGRLNPVIDSQESRDVHLPGSSVSSTQSLLDPKLLSVPEPIFMVTDISPSWAFSDETTKILVIGYFSEDHVHLQKCSIYCVCAGACVLAENIQLGVFRCFVSPHAPGPVNFFVTVDGQNPISQVLTFEYRAPQEPITSVQGKRGEEEFKVQMRLAHLLFSKYRILDILSNEVPQNAFKEAKSFAAKTSYIDNNWSYLMKSIEDSTVPFLQTKDNLFELILKYRLKEWLLERVVEGRKAHDYDDHGQGVIHLCAILGYTWAVHLFSLSYISLDYRDKFGWSALHWASYYGREKMVAVLLSAGAKPNLVTDPTSRNPAGCTAADLASQNGYNGLAAFLAEKALVAHIADMTIAGNISTAFQGSITESVSTEKLDEEELCLKDTLSAYRTAAHAATRIQEAFRQHSLKLQMEAVQNSNPESEARAIVAAMKIQHAFRYHEARKRMAAASRIQFKFRTWKVRKDFLKIRRHAIQIQAAFRGYQLRKQYRKVLWSVGVLEKAILRWRLKRKGLRGLHVNLEQRVIEQTNESDTEEDFFRASRKQAKERVERSVIKVQSIFRSKQAQVEYRRMKLAHTEAKLEYEGLEGGDIRMDA